MKQDEEDRKVLDKKWDKLNKKIKNQNPEYTEPRLPFDSSYLIMDFNELYAKIYDKEKMIQAWPRPMQKKASKNYKIMQIYIIISPLI